jgi:hypothetical protein
MQQTLFAILTDEQARNPEAIEANLERELILGAPWFFLKELPESLDPQEILAA